MEFKKLKYPGLTLVELLIGMGVGSLVLLIILHTFTNLIKVHKKLWAFNQLQTTTTRILQKIQSDIRWAGTVSVVNEHQLLIHRPTETITYQWQNGEMTVSRLDPDLSGRLHDETIKIVEFEVKDVTPEGHLPLVNVLITAQFKSVKLQDIVLEKQVTYTTKRSSYEIQ